MTPKLTGLDSPAPKVEIDPSKVLSAIPKQTSSSEAKVWNTKNLGLRLASDFVSGACAATMVAPVITIIDKAIFQNASGQNTLKNSMKESIKSFIQRPHTMVFSKPFALICMLYGGTYLTANIVDTLTSTVQNKSSTHVTSGTAKFAASSSANIGLCLFKDQAYARLFGPGGPPRPVPFPSYLLFATRDCLTIFASFNVPSLLGPIISKNMGEELQKTLSGQTVAQFCAPAAVQIISTPLHLLGLDMYNRPGKMISAGERWKQVRKNWTISALARMGRIIPAFGVGGVVNAKVRLSLMQKLD